MSPSISARFGGLVMLLIRTRAPASSITSIDLSGCTRPVMYRPESSTAARIASSVIWARWCCSYFSRRPLRICTVSSGFGGSTGIDWNRRANAASFSMYLRYSSKVVAPMHWISPRASAGLRTFDASIAPSAPPAPTSVCSSSMNRITFLALRTSFITALIRSSNCPRYFVPATIIARSSTTRRRSCRISGTSPEMIRCASPSTIAVLPTPASPRSTGLFFVRRHSTCTTRSISRSRPITGSSSPSLASSVRSRPKLSSAGVWLRRFPPRPSGPAPCAPPPPPPIASVPSDSAPAPSRFRTSSRTSSSLSPRFISTCAATPSCSRSRPSNRCSVPT